MGMFSNILAKLGFGGDQAAAAAAPSVGSAVTNMVASAASSIAAGKPISISAVDVVGILEGMAKSNGENLNWQSSIVDLLKLLGLDSSLTARKELATELGCPGEKIADSAQMNTWLHKAVLQKLADNGGNIPSELL